MRRWQWVSDDGKKFRKFVCTITNAEIFYKTYFEAFLLKIGDVNCTGIYKYTKQDIRYKYTIIFTYSTCI